MGLLEAVLVAGAEELVGQGEEDEGRRPLADEEGGILLPEDPQEGRQGDTAEGGPRYAWVGTSSIAFRYVSTMSPIARPQDCRSGAATQKWGA